MMHALMYVAGFVSGYAAPSAVTKVQSVYTSVSTWFKSL